MLLEVVELGSRVGGARGRGLLVGIVLMSWVSVVGACCWSLEGPVIDNWPQDMLCWWEQEPGCFLELKADTYSWGVCRWWWI